MAGGRVHGRSPPSQRVPGKRVEEPRLGVKLRPVPPSWALSRELLLAGLWLQRGLSCVQGLGLAALCLGHGVGQGAPAQPGSRNKVVCLEDGDWSEPSIKAV